MGKFSESLLLFGKHPTFRKTPGSSENSARSKRRPGGEASRAVKPSPPRAGAFISKLADREAEFSQFRKLKASIVRSARLLSANNRRSLVRPSGVEDRGLGQRPSAWAEAGLGAQPASPGVTRGRLGRGHAARSPAGHSGRPHSGVSCRWRSEVIRAWPVTGSDGWRRRRTPGRCRGRERRGLPGTCCRWW